MEEKQSPPSAAGLASAAPSVVVAAGSGLAVAAGCLAGCPFLYHGFHGAARPSPTSISRGAAVAADQVPTVLLPPPTGSAARSHTRESIIASETGFYGTVRHRPHNSHKFTVTQTVSQNRFYSN